MGPVHAHINLLGWVSMAVSGLIYRSYPKAVDDGYAGIRFWLANIGLLAMMPSLALLLSGNKSLVPVLATGEFLTLGAMLVLLFKLWKGARS
jgi:cbb3-type cytochrome oxidase subunit 1